MLRCYDITLSFLIDSAGRDLFHKLCLPWHSVHHSLPAIQKCNNLRDHGHRYELSDLWPPNSPDLGHRYELSDLWPPNSPDLIQLTTNSGQQDTSAECEQFEAASDWCMSRSGTERYRLMELISDADVSMYGVELQEDILTIHCDITLIKRFCYTRYLF